MAEAQATIEERISAALAPPEAPPEAPAEAPVEAETPVEAREEAPEEAEKATPEVESSEGEGEVEEVALETFSELADHLGIEMSDLYNLKLPITDAHGERQDVSIGEWKDGYHNSLKADRLTQEAQDLRDTLQAEKQQFDAHKEKAVAESASLLNSVEQQLSAEYSKVDWGQLKASNQTEYLIRQKDFEDRHRMLTGMRHQAAAKWDQDQTAKQQEFQAQLSEVIERERRSMIARVPEWKDENVMQAEQAPLREYLLDSGYNQQEIDEAYDHRAIVLARKAMKYDAMQSSGKAATKKVVKLGKKILTPGAKRSKNATKKDAEVKMRANLKKSGSIDDAAALITHRLGG